MPSPPAVRHSTMFLVPVLLNPATPEARMELVRKRIEDLLENRITMLHEEAGALATDMEAIRRRLASSGHRARVDDLKSGRWYRIGSEVRLLQNLYTFVCATMGVSEDAVVVALAGDEDSGGVPESVGELDAVSDE